MKSAKVSDSTSELQPNAIAEETSKGMNMYGLKSDGAQKMKRVRSVEADFVLVYEMHDDNTDIDANHSLIIRRRAFFLENLRNYGLECEKIIGKNEKDIYILITSPFHVLLDAAEHLKLKLPIQENDLEVYSNKIQKKILGFRQKISKNEETNFTRRYFTAPYSSNLNDKFECYFDKNDLDNTFMQKDRIVLTYEILCRTSYVELSDDPFEKFENFEVDSMKGIERLLADKTFTSAYPLHASYNRDKNVENNVKKHKNDRQALWDTWARPGKSFNSQPLHRIRRYFGEKIGFYFAWLGYYTQALIIPAIVGTVCFFIGVALFSYDIPTKDICDKNGIGNLTLCPLCSADYCQSTKLYDSCNYARLNYTIDNPASLFFTIFMTIWTVFFIDYWKRKQSWLQFQWDTVGFDNSLENIRTQFEQKVKTRKLNKITGQVEPHVLWYKNLAHILVSTSSVIISIFMVLIFLVGIIAYRVSIRAALHGKLASSLVTSITGACINLVLIVVLSFVYEWIAKKLTDWEHHKTDTQYENSLTIKVYLFQFANFYSAIFYIAFFKGQDIQEEVSQFNEYCDQASCLTELFIQMVIIMIGKQTFNNIKEIILPGIRICFNRRTNNVDNNSKQWEKDNELLSWDELTLFDEYLEMVIQFGFITLFVIAFPLGPLFALLNNIIEIRIDAINVLSQLKRPISKRAQDIGIWLPILDTVSKIGVVTNGFMLAFTSDFIDRLVYQYRYSPDNSLNGYIENLYTTKNLNKDTNNSTLDLCSYRSYREPYNASDPGARTTEYYVIQVARLAFVVAFEHIVFGMVAILHILIPNVPKNVRDQKEREKLLIEKALWEDHRKLKGKRKIKNLAANLISKKDDTENNEELTEFFPESNKDKNENQNNLTRPDSSQSQSSIPENLYDSNSEEFTFKEPVPLYPQLTDIQKTKDLLMDDLTRAVGNKKEL